MMVIVVMIVKVNDNDEANGHKFEINITMT